MPTTLSLRAFMQPTVFVALGLMSIIVIMIVPVPSIVLDIGLTVSFALAILIFTLTLFIERPLDFSSFPTVLLMSLMLRLSLNVASTKLIIGEGHTGPRAAGDVINGFAMFIMGGNVFLGLVVFGVLLIVNFMVITRGAGRMAEVGARFALDGMPGKQLAIDSDMAAGAITHAEASARRKTEQEETTFFGSLDGASKFVKGDAVAGLLITLLNLFMGLAMGIGVHGMSAGDAVQTYSILTVGDGLVSQIPAVIVSVAAALLLSKGGAFGSADRALLGQLGGYPVALGTVAGLLAVFAFVPGLPFLPFIAGSAVLGGAAVLSVKEAEKKQKAVEASKKQETENIPDKTLGDLLDVDEIHIEFAPDLVPIAMERGAGLDNRIVNIRKHIASEYGFIIPEIRLTDNAVLETGSYIIRIQGAEVARSILRPGKVLVLVNEDEPLAIAGEDVKEPVYGAPARWIDAHRQEDAAITGAPVIAPNEVAATHLLEAIQQNFDKLFTRRALRKLLDEFTSPSDKRRADANKRILDEFVPDKAPIDLVQSVMRALLKERISVRNVPVILEAIADAKAATQNLDAIVEVVRQRIAYQYLPKLYGPDGRLPLVRVGAEWEDRFLQHERPGEDGAPDIALPPDDFNCFASEIRERINQAAAKGAYPAIITSSRRRRFVRAVLDAKGVRNPVLSFEEIGPEVKPSILAAV
ncbi:MAG: flagellar biosynthesis protein FlhA [Pseudomonadota bacterium]